MSSYLRLTQFLMECGHDILDIWIYKEMIFLLRIISREHGHMFFMGVRHYEIQLSNEDVIKFPSSTMDSLYYVEDIEEETDSLDKMNPILKRGFSDDHSQYLYFEGCNFETCWNHKQYMVRNLPESDRKGFYLYFPIEWMFENKHVIHFEIQKKLTRFYKKMDRSIQNVVPQYQSMLTTQDQNLIKDLHQQQISLNQEWEKWQTFYQKVCQMETSLLKEVHQFETVLQPQDLTFQETIQRGHRLKMLHTKVDKTIHLRKKLTQKLLFVYQQQWDMFLPLIYQLDQCIQLFQDIRSHLDQLLSLKRSQVNGIIQK